MVYHRDRREFANDVSRIYGFYQWGLYPVTPMVTGRDIWHLAGSSDPNVFLDPAPKDEEPTAYLGWEVAESRPDLHHQFHASLDEATARQMAHLSDKALDAALRLAWSTMPGIRVFDLQQGGVALTAYPLTGWHQPRPTDEAVPYQMFSVWRAYAQMLTALPQVRNQP